MMNRKKVIVGGIIGVLIIIISVVVFLTPQEKPPLPVGNQISPTAGGIVQDNAPPVSYQEFLRSGRSQICTFAYNTENQSVSGLELPSKVTIATIYAANGKIKGEFTLTTKDGTLQQHVLVDAYTAYLWNNLNNGGVKFLVGENSPDELVRQPLVYNCKNWSPNNSVFEIPANIVFTEITDYNPNTP